MLVRNRNWVVGLSLVVGFSGVLIGCGDDAPTGPGGLEVTWKTSPRGCEDSGVEQVNIQLTRDDVSTDNLFPCTDGAALIEEIDPAEYTLTALGLDDESRTIFVAESTKVTVVSDSVRSAKEQVLTAKPAEVKVEWRFDGGAMCNSVGVSEVSVSIFDDADFLIQNDTFSCGDGFTVFGDIKTTGDFTVIAEANGADEKVYRGDETVSLDRGEEAEVIVVMSEEAAQ